ncbi:hypothetical protein ABKV19_006741 [Rosa sericea]
MVSTCSGGNVQCDGFDIKIHTCSAILKIESRKSLMIATLSRILFVPAFYFTAKYGDQGWMIMLTLVLGFTNGYLSVCVVTVAPRGYKGPEQNALGNILVLCLLSGIFVGGCLGWLWLIGKDTF